MRLPRLLPVLLLAAPAMAVEPARVTVRQTGSAVRAATESLAVTVHRRQFSIVARGRGVGTLVREQSDGGLFYERGGVDARARRGDATRRPLADGVAAHGRRPTRARRRRSRSASSRAARSRSRSSRPTPATRRRRRRAPALAAHASASTASPSACATRRRSRPASSTSRSTTSTRPRSARSTAAARRSRCASCRRSRSTRRSTSRRAATASPSPGTTFGVFDLAQDRSATRSRFRFETGTTPESRRLVFHLFVGPEHATILDEYTALTGRPFVPPDWAFLHWRWRDELRVGPPALLDGDADERRARRRRRSCTTRSASRPGVYLFDRPVLAGDFGFARCAWDETRLPNPDAMLASLRAARLPHR